MIKEERKINIDTLDFLPELHDAIFGDSKEIDKTKARDNKYSKIKDFDLSKYQYNYHTKK